MRAGVDADAGQAHLGLLLRRLDVHHGHLLNLRTAMHRPGSWRLLYAGPAPPLGKPLHRFLLELLALNAREGLACEEEETELLRVVRSCLTCVHAVHVRLTGHR